MRVVGRPAGVLVIAGAALLVLAACDATPDPQPTPSASASPAPTDAAPTSVPEPHETDLPPGFDERPDTESAPDAALTGAERTALLRMPATAAGDASACTPDAVSIELWGYDVAAGSRYSSLRVTNAGTEPCTIAGWPGIGARGDWGSRLLLIVEQETAGADPAPVRLEPGMAADAPIRWTGALAGAEQEVISLLVVQLAQDQEATGVEPMVAAATMLGGDSGPPHDARLDIGMTTTVRVGAFAPAVDVGGQP